MTTLEPKTNHRPSLALTLVPPHNIGATAPCSLARTPPGTRREVEEGMLRPTLQSGPARLATVAERKKHEIPACRAADLVFTRRARSGDRIEAVAFGIISLCAAGSIAASFSASFRLIQNWQSFVTFVESMLK